MICTVFVVEKTKMLLGGLFQKLEVRLQFHELLLGLLLGDNTWSDIQNFVGEEGKNQEKYRF